ncbi:MAG: flavin reductase [Eggerthellaceae bacterium]|nr:flavin reductase [Eggerthellaceae bacterium]
MIDRAAFHKLSYGLYIVTAADGGRKFGCVVNTFQQVTSTPPRVSVALNKENATTQAILNSGRYAVSVLSEQATMDLVGVFGFRSSLEVDKFADVAYAEDAAGVPYVTEQAAAWFSMRVIETVDVGTHIMFIGEVEQAEAIDGKPMTYAYYHEVLRGKTPPKASSYEPKEEAAGVAAGGVLETAAEAASAAAPEMAAEAAPEMASEMAVEAAPAEAPESTEAAPKKYAWQCTLCGHIEYLDELPEGYECPLCGMGVDFFERIEI